MSIVCEEVFDETSHPSNDEIRDYAAKIGIDPDEEPQLLPLAAEGLMKALPATWKPCFDESSKSYYYYNRSTGKTQWEHPLDNVYRGLVKKARTESQSFSFGEPTDEATYARDDIPSYEEPVLITPLTPKKLEPFLFSLKKTDEATLNLNNIDIKSSPKHESKFIKQKSEEHILRTRKVGLTSFNSFDDHKNESIFNKHPRTLGQPIADESTFNKHPRILDEPEFKIADESTFNKYPHVLDGPEFKIIDELTFNKHPRILEQPELKVTGGGSMFLKSNTKKNNMTPQTSINNIQPPIKDDSHDQERRSILRDKLTPEPVQDMILEKINAELKAKEDDDKKIVRFNLGITSEAVLTSSDKSLSENETSDGNHDVEKEIKVTQPKTNSRFTVSSVKGFFDEMEFLTNKNLRLIKPNPTDFIKPILTPDKSSDSEDDDQEKIISKSPVQADESNKKIMKKTRELEERMEKRVEQLKKNIWKTKNEELNKFQENLEDSQNEELERIVLDEKTKQEDKIKTELKNLRLEMENRNVGRLREEKNKFDKELEKHKEKLEMNCKHEEKLLKEKFDNKKEELEKYYEEKLVEIEKNLAETMEKSRDDLVVTHNSTIDQLKQNNAIMVQELKKDLRDEEQNIRKEHNLRMSDLKVKLSREMIDLEKDKSKTKDEKYDKMRCEKRLLEDKYKCLKEKYIRLKNDVKLTIEKRNRKKEQSGTTTTTGSETERSFSNKERTRLHSPPIKNLEKPPTPKHSRGSHDTRFKLEHRSPRQLILTDLDTSASDRSYHSEDKANKNDNQNDCDTSDNSINPGRSRKKLFSRLKSSSTSRINNHSKTRKAQRSCSPVENLRKQLQKLEDLEDQFPQNQQSDTYHLRYPFSDGQKFEGSSELEFFRHRIHLERDSIKRAKESLRSQKTLFQQRQKELKLKHGSMARHTLQQLCQEEKELTDLEVSLHRTRSLLGEKVIRLRHLEQSLQRATVANDKKPEDATLSDLSSHSASSGISSTEFATADVNFSKNLFKAETFEESSEIIQSLENLNSEIREIWDVLKKQQQSGSITTVLPQFAYPDLGWPILASTASLPAPPSIPTLADRLNNYRQHIALVNAQSTVVTHANQGATTTLVERTRNLRHWLRQAGIENGIEGAPPQATL